MAALAFPTLTRKPDASSVPWRLISRTGRLVSALNGYIQTQEQPGARWAFTAQWSHLGAADAALMRAFLVSLRGQAGRFTAYNYVQPTIRGTLAGAPAVNGAGQTGALLNVSGCTVGTTLLAGDLIGFAGPELHMVSANGTADGAGQIVVPIEPPIRTSPANAAAVTTRRPLAQFMLSSPEVGWLTHPAQAGQLSDFAIDAIEVWD